MVDELEEDEDDSDFGRVEETEVDFFEDLQNMQKPIVRESISRLKENISFKQLNKLR